MVIWLRVCEWRQGCLARVMTCVMTCVMTGVMTFVMTYPFKREYSADSRVDFWEKQVVFRGVKLSVWTAG